MIGSSPEVMVKAEREPTGGVVASVRRLLGHVHAVRHRKMRIFEDLLLDPKEIAA